MPLNKKGKKIKSAMTKEYGKNKGEQVFYASENKGTIKGVAKKSKKKKTYSKDQEDAAKKIGVKLK
jgi:hypothetical protein